MAREEGDGYPTDVLTAWEENDPYPRGRLVVCEHAGVDAALIALAPELAKWVTDAAGFFELRHRSNEGTPAELLLLAQLEVIVGNDD